MLSIVLKYILGERELLKYLTAEYFSPFIRLALSTWRYNVSVNLLNCTHKPIHSKHCNILCKLTRHI